MPERSRAVVQAPFFPPVQPHKQTAMIDAAAIRLHFMQLVTQAKPLQVILDDTEAFLGVPVLLEDATLFTLGVSRGYDPTWGQDFSSAILEDKAEQARFYDDFENAIMPDAPIRILDYPHMPGRTILLGIHVAGNLSGILRLTEKDTPLEAIDPALLPLLREIYPLVTMLYASTQVESVPDRAFKRLLLGAMDDPITLANCHVFSRIEHHDRYQLIVFRQPEGMRLRKAFVSLLGTEWVTACEDYLCALLFSSAEEPPLSPTMRNDLVLFAAEHQLLICLSDEHSSLSKTYSIFRRMKTALDATPAACSGVSAFDSLKLPLLLSVLRSHGDTSAFYSNAVRSVIDYDRENNSDYLHTLRAYVACSKNAALTAKRLFIHKNTLLYRIQRIHEICGVDFDDPDIWLHICLTLKLLESSPA